MVREGLPEKLGSKELRRGKKGGSQILENFVCLDPNVHKPKDSLLDCKAVPAGTRPLAIERHSSIHMNY